MTRLTTGSLVVSIATVISLTFATGASVAAAPETTLRYRTPPVVVGQGVVDTPQEPRAAVPLPRPPSASALPLPAPPAKQQTRPPGKTPRVAAQANVPATSTRKVALRALVVAVDDNDWGLTTWRATLDRIGTAYDVLLTSSTAVTASTFTRPDGTGRYNAILLTNALLLTPDGSGGFVSTMDATEWATLWTYERDYAVRQAVLYTSYGAWPEDYCLRGGTEGGTGAGILEATLTAAGGSVFDQLKVGAAIPITESYVYRNTLDPACGGEPLLTLGDGHVVGVRSVSADGRERAALSFTSNQYLLQSHFLVFGLYRWATRGLFIGDQRHYLKVDVDDWFNSSDIMNEDLTMSPTPYEVSGHDAYNAYQQVLAIRSDLPQASQFTFAIPFNGEGADLRAGTACAPDGGVDTLTATSRCLRGNFDWVNHTYAHEKLNFSSLLTSLLDISRNVGVAARLGLSIDRRIVKTGEYSGLGVYNDDPNDDISPPTDHGLMASNRNLILAARMLGVRYLHGNMSFPSHVPACFNCNIQHPMDRTIAIVPDWPTNIAYFSSTPGQETAFYNMFYGPNGRFPYWPANQTYDQVIDHESDQGLAHLATGSVYTHTMHISNVHDYGGGRTLATDWVRAVVGKYSAYYSVPLLTPNWTGIADLTTKWRNHFSVLGAVDAIYDPVTAKVTLVSTASGQLFVSGAIASGGSTYGPSVSANIGLRAGSPLTVATQRMP